MKWNHSRWVFLFGLLLGLAVGSNWSALIPHRSGASLYVDVANSKQQPTKIKEDQAFKAEWEKVRKENPKEFEKRKAEFLVMAQMYLGEFGYGTQVTGDSDYHTRDALRAYQSYRGLAVTGETDPATVDQLQADDQAVHEPELFLGPFQFFSDGWDEGALTANGSWVQEGKADPEIEDSQIECYRDWRMCIDGQARQSGPITSMNVVGKFDAYRIKTWDKFEINAESTFSDPCERDALRINRQEKSVTLISIPAYRDQEACQGFLGKPETVTWHLADGTTISGPRNERRKTALRSLMRRSEKAEAILLDYGTRTTTPK